MEILEGLLKESRKAARRYVLPLNAGSGQKNISEGRLTDRRLNCLGLSVMSSYGSLLPSAARNVLSSCRSPLRPGAIAPLISLQQVRGAKSKPQAKKKGKGKKAKKGPQEFAQKDLKDIEQFTLCDAIRYTKLFALLHG